MLGTTKHIVSNNSKQFAKEISKYIDSKDQKRGDKSKKAKAKDKDKGTSLMDRLREQNKKGSGSASGSKSKDNDENGPAYWPLIRQVQVKCGSRALSTGCILVDLPGVADANAARNNIAKDYMKKCDCIWVLGLPPLLVLSTIRPRAVCSFVVGSVPIYWLTAIFQT